MLEVLQQRALVVEERLGALLVAINTAGIHEQQAGRAGREELMRQAGRQPAIRALPVGRWVCGMWSSYCGLSLSVSVSPPYLRKEAYPSRFSRLSASASTALWKSRPASPSRPALLTRCSANAPSSSALRGSSFSALTNRRSA